MADNANSSSNESVLTTLDNPFNPFTQWQEWYNYDTSHGYNTCQYLARVVASSDELTEEEANAAVQSGMNLIMFFNVTGNYILVTEKDFESKIKIS